MEKVDEEQDERIEASDQIEQDAELAKTMQEELDRTVQEKEEVGPKDQIIQETGSQEVTPEKKAFKRMKKAVKTGPKIKKRKERQEEETANVEEEEAKQTEDKEETAQPGQASTQEESLLAMTIATSVDATPLQYQPPLQPTPPKIVNWFVTDERLKHIYTFLREDKSTF